MTYRLLLASSFLSFLLGGCAGVFDSRPAAGDRDVTPQQAQAKADEHRFRKIEWGGSIVQTDNLRDSTEIEIIAYPLKSDAHPDLEAAPTGRFIAVQKGYLESAEYQNGRQVTVSGRITALRKGRIGSAEYAYPIVSVETIDLWPEEAEPIKPKPSVHFGIGIGSGGRTSTGVGVGIGF